MNTIENSIYQRAITQTLTLSQYAPIQEQSLSNLSDAINAKDTLRLAGAYEELGLHSMALDLYTQGMQNAELSESHRKKAIELLLRFDLHYSAATLNPESTTVGKQLLRTDPKITVYVPCYNGSRYLPTCLRAIKNQSYPFIELLVIDDGSTDSSAALAKQYGATVIAHQKNAGLAAARNTAIQAASGELVAAIDCDTIADRFWLERLVIALSSKEITSQELVAVGGRLIEQFSLSTPNRYRQKVMPQHYGETPIDNVPIFGGNSLMKRSALESIGGYNEQFTRSYDDTDVSERLRQRGYGTRYIPNAICRHIREDTLISVLDTCYRWRAPPFTQKGADTDLAILSSKWIVTIREEMRDLERLWKQDEWRLLYPGICGMFRSLVTDLLLFDPIKYSFSKESLVTVGTVMLIWCLHHLKGLSLEAKEHLTHTLLDLIRQNDFILDDSVVSSALTQDKISSLNNERVKDFGNYLLTALDGFPDVFNFPLPFWSASEKSLSNLISETIESKSDRLLLVIDRTCDDRNPQLLEIKRVTEDPASQLQIEEYTIGKEPFHETIERLCVLTYPLLLVPNLTPDSILYRLVATLYERSPVIKIIVLDQENTHRQLGCFPSVVLIDSLHSYHSRKS